MVMDLNIKLDEIFETSSYPSIKEDTYTLSYPYILNYFSGLDKIGVRELVCGAHIVYGWMPTILTIKGTNGLLQEGASILGEAKSECSANMASISEHHSAEFTINVNGCSSVPTFAVRFGANPLLLFLPIMSGLPIKKNFDMLLL